MVKSQRLLISLGGYHAAATLTRRQQQTDTHPWLTLGLGAKAAQLVAYSVQYRVALLGMVAAAGVSDLPRHRA